MPNLQACLRINHIGEVNGVIKDYRQLLKDYGYPADLVAGWSLEDCEAEWQEFCLDIIPE